MIDGKHEFLKTDGRRIVTESGKTVLLRGMGLGGWLLPEGYMWKLFRTCDRPRRMERLVEELAGSAESLQHQGTALRESVQVFTTRSGGAPGSASLPAFGPGAQSTAISESFSGHAQAA